MRRVCIGGAIVFATVVVGCAAATSPAPHSPTERISGSAPPLDESTQPAEVVHDAPSSSPAPSTTSVGRSAPEAPTSAARPAPVPAREGPVVCAELPLIQRREAIPEWVRDRLSVPLPEGALDRAAVTPGSVGRSYILATIRLDWKAAVELVKSCPGLDGEVLFSGSGLARITVRAKTYGALTRLAQHPAVVSIQRRRDMEDDPH